MIAIFNTINFPIGHIIVWQNISVTLHLLAAELQRLHARRSSVARRTIAFVV